MTQAEYQKVASSNPSNFPARGTAAEKGKGMDTARHPVEMATWEDANGTCWFVDAAPEEHAEFPAMSSHQSRGAG